MKTKKDFLISLIENMNEEETNFLYTMFTKDYFTTRELITLFAPELNNNKIDTAYPCDYASRIREIYPDFNNGFMVYDYNENIFGSMLNLNNIIAKKFLTYFETVLKNYSSKQ